MHLQFDPEKPVFMAILDAGSSTDIPGNARILGLTGRCLQIAANQELRPGTLVKLQWDGNVLLAEVRSADPFGGTQMLHTEHVLTVEELNSMQELWV